MTGTKWLAIPLWLLVADAAYRQWYMWKSQAEQDEMVRVVRKAEQQMDRAGAPRMPLRVMGERGPEMH